MGKIGQNIILIALISIPVAASLAEVVAWRTAGFIATGVENVSTIIGMFILGILHFRELSQCEHVRTILRIVNTGGRASPRALLCPPFLFVWMHQEQWCLSSHSRSSSFAQAGRPRQAHLSRAVSTAAGAAILPCAGPMMRAAVLQTSP